MSTKFFFVSFIEANQFFDNLCRKHNVECGSPRTTARLIDKVILMEEKMNKVFFL